MSYIRGCQTLGSTNRVQLETQTRKLDPRVGVLRRELGPQIPTVRSVRVQDLRSKNIRNLRNMIRRFHRRPNPLKRGSELRKAGFGNKQQNCVAEIKNCDTLVESWSRNLDSNPGHPRSENRDYKQMETEGKRELPSVTAGNQDSTLWSLQPASG